MKRIILLLATILLLVLFFSLYFYEKEAKKLENLSQFSQLTSNQAGEKLVDILEKLRLAGSVNCDHLCIAEKVHSNLFMIDSILVDRLDDALIFFEFAKRENRNLIYKLAKTHKIDLEPLKIIENPQTNYSGNFTMRLNNLHLKSQAKSYLSFLTWYLDNDSYSKLASQINHLDIIVQSEFEIQNSKLSIDKLNLILTLPNSVENEQIATLNYDITSSEHRLCAANFAQLKPSLRHFKQIIELFLSSNQEIIFASQIAANLDAILDDSSKQFCAIANLIFDKKFAYLRIF